MIDKGDGSIIGNVNWVGQLELSLTTTEYTPAGKLRTWELEEVKVFGPDQLKVGFIELGANNTIFPSVRPLQLTLLMKVSIVIILPIFTDSVTNVWQLLISVIIKL